MKRLILPWDLPVTGGFLGVDPQRDLPHPDWITLKQVHGNQVVLLQQAQDLRQDLSEGDALVSSLPGVTLAVKSADCVPILWAHPAGVVAAVHAGWKGSLKGVLRESLRALEQNWGFKPSEVHLAIGPAISGEVYEVGPEVAEGFAQKYPHCLKPKGKKFLLDLKEFNRQEALKWGLAPERILVFSHCTYADKKFHSHRRAMKMGQGKAGRNYSYIAYNP